MLASRERRETSVALTSTLHWFETEALAQERHYQWLSRLNTDLVQHDAAQPSTRRVTLDIDSSESPVHGAQELSAYNGHFESVCYHPLWGPAPAPLRPLLGHTPRATAGWRGGSRRSRGRRSPSPPEAGRRGAGFGGEAGPGRPLPRRWRSQ